MKKIAVIGFCISFIACFGLFLFCGCSPNDNIIIEDFISPEENSGEEESIVFISVPETIELVQGQRYKNSELEIFFPTEATFEILPQDESILEQTIINSENFIIAKSAGTTNVTFTASYNGKIDSKSSIVEVFEKQIDISFLNSDELLVENFKAGEKFDHTFENYTLKIETNFDIFKAIEDGTSQLILDEKIFCSDYFLTNENQTLFLNFYLLLEGDFNVEFDEILVSNTSVAFISKLDLFFENVELSFDEQQSKSVLTLYNLGDLEEEVKTEAYHKFYDYAQISSSIENFNITVLNEDFVAFQGGKFVAVGFEEQNETVVKFTAKDGSGFEEEIIVRVSSIIASGCEIQFLKDGQSLSKEEINLIVGDSFEIVTTIIPIYATVKQIEISIDNSSIVRIDEKNTVTTLASGTVTINVILNEVIIETFEVNIEEEIIPTPPTVYYIDFVVPGGVQYYDYEKDGEDVSIALWDGNEFEISINFFVDAIPVAIDGEERFATFGYSLISGNGSIVRHYTSLTVVIEGERAEFRIFFTDKENEEQVLATVNLIVVKNIE